MSAQLLALARSVWRADFPTPLDMGVESGIVWATCPGPMGGVNGYVLIPAEGHLWSKGCPDDVDELLDVHGGITYHGHPWLGFDTNHAFDVWLGEYAPKFPSPFNDLHHEWSHLWDPAQVAVEAALLAKQVASIGGAIEIEVPK